MEFEKLQELLADVLETDPSQIRPDKSLVGDFGADSLMLFQMMMNIEATFGILIDDEIVMGWDTVGNIWDYLQKGRKE